MASWITVSEPTIPGMDIKYTLFPRKQVDQHQAVVQACVEIARMNNAKGPKHCKNDSPNVDAERFAMDCLLDF